jgi:classical protein kinase C
MRSFQTSEIDQKIQDVFKRIQTERKVLEASQHLRQATTNQDVLRSNDAKIREAEMSLLYFEDTLRELQARKMQQSRRDDPSRSGLPSSPQVGLPSNRASIRPSDRDRSLPQIPQAMPYDPRTGRQPTIPGRGMPPTPQPGLDNETTAKAKTYTNLDLIKADTPHSAAKISRILHQLEFKLQVEMQYKKGIDKMAKLYQADGDKKSRADAESKKVESEKKILLLQSALKNLHIFDVVEEEEEGGGGESIFLASNCRDRQTDAS